MVSFTESKQTAKIHAKKNPKFDFTAIIQIDPENNPRIQSSLDLHATSRSYRSVSSELTASVLQAYSYVSETHCSEYSAHTGDLKSFTDHRTCTNYQIPHKLSNGILSEINKMPDNTDILFNNKTKSIMCKIHRCIYEFDEFIS